LGERKRGGIGASSTVELEAGRRSVRLAEMANASERALAAAN
jgi:hypothetical protein